MKKACTAGAAVQAGWFIRLFFVDDGGVVLPAEDVVLGLAVVLVVVQPRSFYRINKLAAYLQIPYILWLVFAAVLNYSIFILNV